MNKRILWALAATSLLVSTATVGQPYPEMGLDYGMGMGWGQGMMRPGMMGPGGMIKLRQLYASGNRDDNAINAAYKRMREARRQMFDTMIDARKQTDDVPTKEQRDELRRNWDRWGR